LLNEALSADSPEDAPEPESELAAMPGPSEGVVSRLSVRRDFRERYDFLENIGQGGQGEIWKVWDFEFRRVVAMKRLAAGGPQPDSAFYRFVAEAQIASQLEHPGVLPIFDAGRDPEGRPFYTTQLLPGTTFGHIWRKVHDPAAPEWPVNRALDLLLRVCDVVAHAHSRGVIHRDLKPSNILVGAFGDVRVIDWGSAHVLREARKNFEEPFAPVNSAPIQTDREDAVRSGAESIYATAQSGLSMTVLYTAPELLRGELNQIGPQTDIYSMGVMLYELASGRSPYFEADGRDPGLDELKRRILAGPPRRLRSFHGSITRDLAAICEKAMAYEKAARYPTMEELGGDIRAALELRPVQARRPGPLLKLQKWGQRNMFHALAAGAVVVIASAAFFVTKGLQAQRDAARQVTALRSAELAARSGQWRASLQHLDEAEAAGYHDGIYLHLQRAEAWTVLNEPQRSQAELAKLVHRSDLGSQRGTVLLRVGEHELFDQGTSDGGVRHILEALAAGLSGADEAFAKGLLAQSTLDALSLFQQALVANPYHHGAHVHTLGLEFLLGRHQELETESHIFKTLYPEDPSPVVLEATELALESRLPDAHARLAALAGSANPEMLKRLESNCQQMAAAAKYYDVNTFLSSPQTNLNEVMLETAPMLLANDLPSPASPKEAVRIPQLPCVKQGMLEGFTAVRSLAIPFLSDPKSAVQKIQSGWQHHPEALMPALAGMLLDRRQPREGAKSIPLLSMQAGLFQMAADSPSILPNLPRLARYLAAKCQFELARSRQPDSTDARRECLQNVRRVCAADDCSAAELAAYYDFAFPLEDYDLARELLVKWESRQPANPLLLHKRIELELVVGALGAARERLDELLLRNPGDSWALEQKEMVLRKIKAMSESVPQP
jgi:serine/threonine protein kinase